MIGGGRGGREVGGQAGELLGGELYRRTKYSDAKPRKK